MALAPEQSRAARGWLDITQEQLAKLADVSLSTVRDFEKGRRVPITNNLNAMSRVFEAHGIQLVFDEERAAGILTVRPAGLPTSPEAGKNQESGGRV